LLTSDSCAQGQRELVTDPGIKAGRAALMSHHPVFAARNVATSMERVIVYSSTSNYTVNGARPARNGLVNNNNGVGGLDADAIDAGGEMTAHQFGYSNTAEAFVAVQVRAASLVRASDALLIGTSGVLHRESSCSTRKLLQHVQFRELGAMPASLVCCLAPVHCSPAPACTAEGEGGVPLSRGPSAHARLGRARARRRLPRPPAPAALAERGAPLVAARLRADAVQRAGAARLSLP
jgi:hypothetical protein